MLSVALFSNQFAGSAGHGLARYARELYSRMQEHEDILVRPVAAWSDLEPNDLDELRSQTGLCLLPTGRRVTPALWNWAGLPRLEHLLSGKTDIVHAASLGYPIATRRPFVVTIHDLGPLTQPEFFSNTKPWIMRASLDRAVSQAAAIICVSESTRQEVLEVVGQSVADRLHVVPQGISLAGGEMSDWTALAANKSLPDEAPIILAAGQISPRKNIGGVINAFAALKDRVPHHLVIAGGDGWDHADVRNTVENLGIGGRVHFTGYLPDSDLRALYVRASAYLHPSFYEGFGLTVLEAMAAGTPVITSNVTSLPEVAGDAAILVTPGIQDELVDALERVLTDEDLATRLSERGIQRAGRFSWTSAADAVAEIYRSVA